MRVTKGKTKKEDKKSSPENPVSYLDAAKPKYVGNNLEDICKPVAPGRLTKALSGPVHPGFEGSAAKANKKKEQKSKDFSVFSLQKADNSKDLYSPMKKGKTKSAMGRKNQGK